MAHIIAILSKFIDPVQNGHLVILVFVHMFYMIPLFFYFMITGRIKGIIKRLVYFSIVSIILSLYIQYPESRDLDDIQLYEKFKNDVSKNNYFHLMTYNVRASSIDKIDDHSWKSRKQAVKEWINQLNQQNNTIDIIGLQELEQDQQEFFKNDIFDNQFGVICQKYKEDKLVLGTAILYNKQINTMIVGGIFYLSSTPYIEYSKIASSALVRTCSWGHFRRESKNSRDYYEYYLFNVHLDHISEEARQKQSLILIDQIKNITKNSSNVDIYITGDFNSIRGSVSHSQILVDGFKDLWESEGITHLPNQDQVATFHAYLGNIFEKPIFNVPFKITSTILKMIFKTKTPFVIYPENFHIDFIFAKQLNNQTNILKYMQVWDEKIYVEQQSKKLFVSDHYPISIYVDVNQDQ